MQKNHNEEGQIMHKCEVCGAELKKIPRTDVDLPYSKKYTCPNCGVDCYIQEGD